MRRSRAEGRGRERGEGRGAWKARGEREGAQGKRKWRYVGLRVLEGDFLVQRRRRAAGLTHPHRKQQIYYIAVNGGLVGGRHPEFLEFTDGRLEATTAAASAQGRDRNTHGGEQVQDLRDG